MNSAAPIREALCVDSVRSKAMPKGPNGERRPADVVGCAVKFARVATGEIEDTGYKQPANRKGGLALDYYSIKLGVVGCVHSQQGLRRVL